MMRLRFQFGIRAFSTLWEAFSAGQPTQWNPGSVADDFKDFSLAKSPQLTNKFATISRANLDWLRACTLVAPELVKKPHWEFNPGRKEK
jgi:hypothetical protein